MAGMGIGPVFIFGLSSLSPTIVDEYGITEGQFGYLITALFLTSGIASTLLGRLSDRMALPAQFLILHLGTAVAFLVSLIAARYEWMLVAAVIAGVAQAQSNPVTNRVVAERVPAARRSTWMGWKQSGVQMGMLAAGATFPFLGAIAGWPGAAIVGAAACVPLALASWLLTRRLGPAPAPVAAPTDAASAGARESIARRALWLFPLASFLNAVGTQGFNAFAALFAVRGLGAPMSIAAWTLAAIGLIGVVSRIGWGRVSGRAGQPSRLLAVMSIGGMLAMAMLTVAELTGESAFVAAAIPLHAALPLAANVVINSGIVAMAPRERMGQASGLVATGMYLGFAAGPAIVGALIDATGTYRAGWVAMAVSYAACIVIALRIAVLEQRRSQLA